MNRKHRSIQGLLMLMDVGAEYQHYTADVTRTFPVNGKFTQRASRDLSDRLRRAGSRREGTKPGANLTQVHNAATEVIKDGLLKLGLITDRQH